MRKKIFALAAAVVLATLGVQAQVMKAADLEKYAKQRYGEKWLDAAMNLSQKLTLDKNESLTYQEVVEAPGVRVTYTVQSYDIMADVSGGWLSFPEPDQRTYGDSKRKKDDKTNAYLYDEQWEIARHYPFVEKDPQKRTCAKALVMTHAYSNAIIDKVEEALKNGLVGNDNDDW